MANKRKRADPTTAFNPDDLKSRVQKEIEEDGKVLFKHFSEYEQLWEDNLSLEVDEDEVIHIRWHKSHTREGFDPQCTWEMLPGTTFDYMDKKFDEATSGSVIYYSKVVTAPTLPALVERYFETVIAGEDAGIARVAKMIKGFMWRYPHRDHPITGPYLDTVLTTLEEKGVEREFVNNVCKEVYMLMRSQYDPADFEKMVIKRNKSSNTPGYRAIRRRIYKHLTGLQSCTHKANVSILSRFKKRKLNPTPRSISQ